MFVKINEGDDDSESESPVKHFYFLLIIGAKWNVKVEVWTA